MEFSAKKKEILKILADGQFHSGTDLAERLIYSRSAIWKHIHGLNECGIEITAVNGKGYRLHAPVELLDKELITHRLAAHISQHIAAIEIHDQIDSTNRYLNTLTHNKPESTGIICLAEQQTAGKGRRGRQWVSPFASNIYLSVLWQFQEGPASLSGLSLAIGVAVVKALHRQGIHGAGLKWPNDIYCQQKKLGGILIEVSGEANGPCSAVIGLGLNLDMPLSKASDIEQDWIDIKQIIGDTKKISRNKLLTCLIEEIISVTTEYTQQSFAYYRDEWRQYDCMQGKRVNLYMGNKTIQGSVQGINNEGLLLLQTEEGQVQSFASGEVSFHRS